MFAKYPSTLVRQMTIVSFLSIGMALVSVTGNIDLSVGSCVGLVSAITAWLQAVFLPPLLQHAFPGISVLAQGTIITGTTILSGILVVGLIGLVQGSLPNSLGYALGILSVASLFFWMFYNRRRKASYGISLRPFGVDLLQTLIFSTITSNTRLGRYAYALGGSAEATSLSGVNTKANVFQVFVLMGLLTGISVMNIPAFWQFVIRGLVLVLAVYMEVATKKRNG